MRSIRWVAAFFGAGVVAASAFVLPTSAGAAPAAQPVKAAGAVTGALNGTSAQSLGPVILDEDMGELGDGAQSMLMLLQAHADLLGITTVAGNTWVEEGLADTLSQEALINRHVPVYRGANVPLSGNRQAELPLEDELYGPSEYVGAWSQPEPPSYLQLPNPPYGGYPTQHPAKGSAAQFIVDMARKYPHQLTIVAGGPLTNIALAIQLDPGIVGLIKQVVYMGGAITVPGNTTPAAEFNIWFDPSAAKIVLNAPWKKFIDVPLDLTNQVIYTKKQYDKIVAGRPTPIKKAFEALQGPSWASAPNHTEFVYDETATAIFLEPSLLTSSTNEFVDVDAQFGLDFGRLVGFTGNKGPFGSHQIEVVNHINIPQFFKLYIGLMRAPIS